MRVGFRGLIVDEGFWGAGGGGFGEWIFGLKGWWRVGLVVGILE